LFAKINFLGVSRQPLDALRHRIARTGGEQPTLPLWLAEDFSVPLDLEESYEETCRVLRIPVRSRGTVPAGTSCRHATTLVFVLPRYHC
jgi:hypothetical protein